MMLAFSKLLVVIAAVAVAAATGCSVASATSRTIPATSSAAIPGGARVTGSSIAAQPRATRLHTVSALKRCLRKKGAKTGAVKPEDASMRSLHDVAQKTSFEVRFGKSSRAGVAVAPSIANAKLLVELLRIPRISYVVTHVDNVVLLVPKRNRKAAKLVIGCARGA